MNIDDLPAGPATAALYIANDLVEKTINCVFLKKLYGEGKL